MDGWIKMHRLLLEKPIWLKSTANQKVILITLLLMANHKPNEWEWQGKKFEVKEGQFITSIEGIKQKAGKDITTQNVRSALNKFEKYDFLTNKSTKTGRLISIVNWQVYQDVKQEGNKANNKEVTKNQQRTNKEVTSNKNDKNDKNDKNKILCDFFEEIWSAYPRKKGKRNINKASLKEINKIGKENMLGAISEYIKEIKKHETAEKYIKLGSTFFNGGYQDYLEMHIKNKNKVKAKPVERVIIDLDRE